MTKIIVPENLDLIEGLVDVPIRRLPLRILPAVAGACSRPQEGVGPVWRNDLHNRVLVWITSIG